MMECIKCSKQIQINNKEIDKKLNLKNIIGEETLCIMCRIRKDLGLKENTLVNQPIINAWYNDFDRQFTDVDFCVYEGIYITKKKPSKEKVIVPIKEDVKDIAESMQQFIDDKKCNVIICLRLSNKEFFTVLCIDDTKEELDKLKTKEGKQEYINKMIDHIYENKVN